MPQQYGGYFPATYQGFGGYSGQQVSPDITAQNMQAQALAQAQAAQQQRMAQAQALQNMQMPQMMQGQQMQVPQPQAGQIQNGGFVIVKDEKEAYEYPVAPGTSVTFIDEARKHLYIKTVGLNMFDKFEFRKFLITEETVEAEQEAEKVRNHSEDIEDLRAGYEELKREIAGLRKQIESKAASESTAAKKKPAVKKEA